MALATVLDVVARLERDLTTEESAKASGLLEEASDLVDAFLGWEGVVPEVIPGPVVRVTSRMVARMLEQASTRPIGGSQVTQTMGPFSESVTFETGAASGSVWMSASDKMTLKRLRVGSGMTSVRLASEQTGTYRTEV